jgi:cAMP phosphodiesterase
MTTHSDAKSLRVRVLGCDGAIAKGCRTTSFLLGPHVLLDAGTGVGDLTLDEMAAISHVMLTHSHLDHIAALPLMLDAVGARRTCPLLVHALPETIAALRQHVFNNVIWPDFTHLPSDEAPFLRFVPLAVGERVNVEGLQLEVLPAAHSVPAVGYAVSATGPEGPHWVFSGDTAHNPAFWQRLNQLTVGALVIETAFSDREQALASLSGHYCPSTLLDDLSAIPADTDYPIFITHTKPAEAEQIFQEILQLNEQRQAVGLQSLAIALLHIGQIMKL